MFLLLAACIILTRDLDTPFPIDPFTFISAPVVKAQPPPKPSFAVPAIPPHVQAVNGRPALLYPNSIPPVQGVRPVPTAVPVMAAPNIPMFPQDNAGFIPVQYQPVTLPGTGSSVQLMATGQGLAKRVALQPRTPFPPALMPYLADKVASLNSGNLTWLVESLYQDLKTHGVKKIAIEAKVREDCEKCPQRKVWVVKANVLVSRRSCFACSDRSSFATLLFALGVLE